MKYPFLAAQLFNTPLVARPETAEAFARAFMQVLSGAQVEPAAGAAKAPDAFAGSYGAARFRDKPYAVTDAGVAILPIYGALAQRAGEITPACTELASYERLGRKFNAMLADADVKAILLEIDSPGGQVAGNFELARRIANARSVKPVWAHANEMALSGGYSLAASAQVAYVPDTGFMGSIGTVMLHMSQAERDAKQGYQYTAIYAGARKNDGNPHLPLSEEARAHIQSMVDSAYQVFVDHVAAHRGLSADAVRATEAAVFVAADAVKARLADGIATFAEALDRLETSLRGATVQVPGPSAHHQHHPVAGSAATQLSKENAMTDSSKPAGHAQPDPAAPKPDAAPADVANIKAEGRIEERARIGAILTAPEAKGRQSMASHLAFETDMSAEAATKLLAKAPVENVGTAAGGDFASAMNALRNPAVGADAAPAAEVDADAIARRIAGMPPVHPTNV